MATTTNAQPGTLYARSTTGSIAVPPQQGRIIRFGRNLPQKDPEVHLAFGPEDERVSRRHGELTYVQRQWWLRHTGRRPMRLPRGEMIYADTEPIPLAAGQTWVYVKGTSHRDHVVELFVTDDHRHRATRRATP
jgi:pSer/pThr/pTyr-binding forkhead associated (FHA) protein